MSDLPECPEGAVRVAGLDTRCGAGVLDVPLFNRFCCTFRCTFLSLNRFDLLAPDLTVAAGLSVVLPVFPAAGVFLLLFEILGEPVSVALRSTGGLVIWRLLRRLMLLLLPLKILFSPAMRLDWLPEGLAPVLTLPEAADLLSTGRAVLLLPVFLPETLSDGRGLLKLLTGEDTALRLVETVRRLSLVTTSCL